MGSVIKNLGVTPAKWNKPEEVVTEGLYLFKADNELPGNSTLTYIAFINDVFYVNSWSDNNVENIARKAKLICKANKKALFYGPIPTPPKS